MRLRINMPPVAFRCFLSISQLPLLVILVVLSQTNPAHAVLLAEERFLTSASPTGPEYSLGAIAGQNASTPGFSGAWFTSTGTSPAVDAATLDYSDANFPAETGGKLLVSSNNSRVHRLLGASNPFESTDSGTVYLSFLLQTGTNNGYRAFEMHNGGNDDAANRKFQVGLSSFGDFPTTGNPQQFGFAVNNGAFKFNLGAEDSNVHLFLVKFSLSTSNNADSITVWNNPSLASLASDPTGGVTASGFNFAADRLGVGRFTGTAPGFDELRIGTSLQDVLTDTLICDVNGNGVCNSSDVKIISDHMYLAGAYEDGDLDGSGLVDVADYRLFKDHPNRVVGFDPPESAAGVPEPAGVVLCGVAMLCCFGLLTNRMPRPRFAVACGLRLLAWVSMPVVLFSTQPVQAIDLLNDNIQFSPFNLELRPYATLPAGFNDMISLTTRPGDTRMYVTTQEGTIFVINENSSGGTSASPWFNVAAGIDAATDRSLFGESGHDGLQSVAFHPEFINPASPGYGKIYTTLMETRPASVAGHNYLGDSSSGNGQRDSVLLEWTYSHETGQVDPSLYRELFRARLPNADHMIKQAKFNQYAKPGDEDYGLLYLTHGDSSSQQSTEDRPQHLDNISGKMLRINPLESGSAPYSIPTSNPFYGDSDPAVLEEIYAYGMRNPHNFSFNRDAEGGVHILVGDIGRANIEEVNLVVKGGNFGWTEREGTFLHLQNPDNTLNSGYYAGVSAIPDDEADLGLGYIYPVAQFDHNTNADSTPVDQPYSGMAISSSFVIRNGSDPDLQNQFVFANFAYADGNVYHTDFDEMLGAKTTLEPGDLPGDLTQAELHRLRLSLDHDNNPNTPPQLYDEFTHLLGSGRSDTRYGEGISGEMYISNKFNNIVYLVTNSLPEDRLTLTVDRGTGEMTISNGTGGNISVDNVSVFSPSGSLAPAGFESLGVDWNSSAANSIRALQQTNAVGAITLDGIASAALGDIHDPQLLAFGEPAGEDIQFMYFTAGPEGRSFTGEVVYTGVSAVPNTIVLTVDVASGRASMLNQTPFSQQVEVYTISSENGSLDTAGWNSLDAQGIESGDWIASPALATRLTEIQEDGTTTFDELTPFNLGEILQSGAERDLEFEFLLAGEGSLRQGMVVYILAGDYNGDHVVDAADYTLWRDNLNTTNRLANDMTPGAVTMDDYAVWKNNFGAVLAGSGSGAGSSAVPEPGSLRLMLAGVVGLLVASRARPKF